MSIIRGQLESWKQAIIDARTGHEWAFYTGTAEQACPEVVRRVAVLTSLIAEHSEEHTS